MMNRLNRVSKRGVQAAFTLLKFSLLALALVTFFERADLGLFFVQKWIWFATFCYLGGMVLSEWEPSYRVLGKIGILGVGLFAIVIMVMLGLNRAPTFAKMVAVVAYALLWQQGCECFSTKLYLDSVRKQFIITLLILFVSGVVHIVSQVATVHMELTYHYLPLFCVIGLLHLYSVNVNDVYATTEMNAVNKERNLGRLNALVALLVSVFFMALQTGFFGILTSERLASVRDSVVSGIATFFAVLSYPFMWMIERLIVWLKAIIEKNRLAAEDTVYEVVQGASGSDALPVRETEMLLNPELLQGITYALWGVVIATVCVIFYRAYKKKRPQKEEEIIDEEGEERTFVFDIAEWFKGTRPVKAAIDHLAHQYHYSHLSPIRQRYVAFLIAQREKGHIRPSYMTPSAYLEHLKDLGSADQEAQSLTEKYNEDRY